MVYKNKKNYFRVVFIKVSVYEIKRRINIYIGIIVK